MASSSYQNKAHPKSLLPDDLATQKSTSESLVQGAIFAIQALGYARIGLGAASLLAPSSICGLFRFLISNETAIVVRMFGVRGVALGYLILNADHADQKTLSGREELKRMLWANFGCDVADICSIAFAVTSGHMDRLPGTFLAGGAAVCVAMALLGIKTIEDIQTLAFKDE
ncbi:unnamed protein product [Clonostachys byssicola]|uniref:Uncharacterized protein n=1 Tax=Clonostachys byssicola TaxID=160290 RepID=A0A9N9XYL0_9HYPO|nr:unnamed protein product [Clonostachys byssicola]